MGGGADLVDRQIRPVVFLFLGESQADGLTHDAVNQQGADDRNDETEQGAEQLTGEADATHAPQGFTAENPGGYATPGAAQTVQRPHAQHVVYLPAVLGQREHHHGQLQGHQRT